MLLQSEMTTKLNISVSNLVTQFQAIEDSFPANIVEAKKKAIGNFESLGLPTTKNEEWKYTNLSALLNTKFDITSDSKTAVSEKIKQFLPNEKNAAYLVFVNGIFQKQYSDTNNLPEGIIAGNIAEHIEHPAVNSNLSSIALIKSESFVSLNTAMFLQGAFIFVPTNVVCEIPIHLIYMNDAVEPVISHPRNLVFASVNSQIKISENCYSLNSVNAAFTNAVTEICLEENANVEYCKNQAESNNDFRIDYTAALLHKDSNLKIHTITTGGKIVRNNLNIVLADRNASAHLNGLYITSDEMHVDNHSFVDHKSPDCYSNELYKGVLGGKSSGVFNGKIFVRRDAQKTNAYQSNKNILLSLDASMNAKPQLEIYADDVKCSHGATTGQLDEEALFYLRSRGIGIGQARALLTTAFAEDIIERVTITSTREKLEEILNERLKGM
jgi:Fe-S cluster assembly protein SufD